ncbi:MAG: hypothetical protein ACO3EE_08690 [Flavobacteriales bacterium]
MTRKYALIFFCITSLFSCQKEIISVLLLRGEWNITELTVKK